MKYYRPKYAEPPQQFFGITAALAAPLIGGLEAAGIGEATAGVLGSIGAGSLLGAGGGALLSGIEGQNPLTGALTGALTGGAIGAGPALGAATGIGTTAADVGLGAAAGAGGAALTGGNPLLGAATGGAAGLASGVLGGAGAGATPTTSPVAAATGPSAASFGISAPATTAAPATSATPLAASAGGGAPATTQLASAAGGGVSDAATAGAGGQGVSSNWPGFADSATAGGTQWPSPSATTPIPSAGGGDMLSRIGDFASKNPALLLSAAPLALSMFGGPSPLPSQGQLKNQSLQDASVGKTLNAFQFSGTLPPGMQSIIDQKNAAAKAEIRSKFAQLGYTGSTAEQQQLEQVDQSSAGQIAMIGQQLASQGLDWTRLSTQELETLLSTEQKSQSDFSSALSNFAKGMVPLAGAFDKTLTAAA